MYITSCTSASQRSCTHQPRLLLRPIPPAIRRCGQIDRQRDRMHPLLLLADELMAVGVDQLKPPLDIGHADTPGRMRLHLKVGAIDYPEQQPVVVDGQLDVDPDLSQLLRGAVFEGILD